MPQIPSQEESPAIRLACAKLATSLFTASFGSRPAVVTSAPGRVNLIGEHTEHHGGPVLSIPIERRTAVAAGLATHWVGFSTLDLEPRELELEQPAKGRWSDYLVSAIRELRAIGAAPPGANIAIASRLPDGGGLASSTALTVAAAKALSLLAGRRLTRSELVEVAFRAEYAQVGIRCCRGDQAAAIHGQRGMAFLFESATRAVRPLPFPGRLWVMDTGVSPQTTNGVPSLSQRQCQEALPFCRAWRPGLAHLAQLTRDDLEELPWRLPPPLVPPVRHVITETARTRSGAAALAAGDLRRLGRLMVEAHESLRQDYDSPIAEADILVSSAVTHGAYGARLTAGGWGRAVILLAPLESEARILAQVSQDFHDRFGRMAQVWSTRAAAGVRREGAASRAK